MENVKGRDSLEYTDIDVRILRQSLTLRKPQAN
jgi:hypothetical protein